MEEPKSKAKRGAKTAAAAQEDKITLLPLSELHDFPNHPFKVRDDEAMQETTESIRQYGVLVPAIVRPREDGGYEIIAGHRRRHGSELAGLSAMPCIVRQMDDDTATSGVIVELKYCRATFTISFFWSAFITTAIQAARESRMLVTSLTAPLPNSAISVISTKCSPRW